jgi:hypothetical protein
LSRWEVRLLHAANLLVGATGLLYGWLRYFAEPVDELSAVHPWQPAVQHLHLLAAPLLVFALGLFWRAHALAGLRLGTSERRRTGSGLLVAAAPMVASGYLLQTAVEPSWRRAWIVLHVAASLLWLALSALHQLRRRARRSSPSR